MKKTLKTVLSLVAVIALIFSMTACSKGGSNSSGSDVTAPANNGSNSSGSDVTAPANSEIVSFINGPEGSAFLDSFENSFEASSGLDCDCVMSASGNNLVIDIKLDGIDNVPASSKAELQSAFDGMKDALRSQLSALTEIVPSIAGMTFNFCEEDGDYLASVSVSL